MNGVQIHKGRKPKYPFREMEVDATFVVDPKPRRFISYLSRYSERYGRRFSGRTVGTACVVTRKA